MITSKTNSQFKRWVSLLTSDGIKEHKQYLVFGKKAVLESMLNFPDDIIEIISFENAPKIKQKTIECAKNLFDELDLFNTKFPILVLKTPELEKIDLNSAPSGFEILCPLGDPRNLGALVRTAHTLGASKIVLLTEAANPFLPHSVRAASGSLQKIKFFRGPSIKTLRDFTEKPQYIALDMNGKMLSQFVWPLDLRLVVGEEGPGLKDLEFKTKITIPQLSGADSLNATIATAIALYSYRCQYPILD